MSNSSFSYDDKSQNNIVNSSDNFSLEKGKNCTTDMAEKMGYVIITDYVKPNCGKPVDGDIQNVINNNPNKTIYFPDGEYLLSAPIKTSAKPVNSVSLQLSNYAVLRAVDNWNSADAMICLGGAEPFNDINTPGSNYFFAGGIVDGAGKADGISIDSGRETAIRNVSIKGTRIGIHIKYGANSGSSDADINTVNIVGNGKPDSIGVLVNGFDNTFDKMRIANVLVGFKITGAGNFLKNIHPLFIFSPEITDLYSKSIAFLDVGGGGWYEQCYSDQFAVGFKMTEQTQSIYSNCFCFWYTSLGGTETGFFADGKFNSVIQNSKVTFREDTSNSYLCADTKGGGGVIQFPIFDINFNQNNSYKDYLFGTPVWFK